MQNGIVVAWATMCRIQCKARESSVGKLSKRVPHGDDRNEVTFSMVSSNIPAILSCEDFSNLQRLLHVTAYVLKFTRLAKRSPNQDSQPLDRPGMNLSTEDINAALIYWLRISQLALPDKIQFHIMESTIWIV